ncbi:MAG TPA: hypothetical protein VOB72_21650 [Candidatus Dormibacteraeota bacterium]|nr:hypothetical protein [Candidatus Dormibacteraeota bacterium]
MAALAATVLASGCAPPRYAADTPRPTLELDGPSAAFSIGQERFAVAAFGPPASLLLVRAGPVYFWATPAPGLHELYVQERVGGRPVADHVLVVDGGGRVDCTYTLRWKS